MFDYYTLDGVNNTDPDFNTYVGLPSSTAFEEFKVQTGVYSAEFGHEASQVNVVSKSGTNTYHGAMYEFIRNNYVDANPYFFPYNAAPPKVFPFKWNDYGFELDGPIRIPKIYDGRDKFFFMVDDEWRNIRSMDQGQADCADRRHGGRQLPGLHHRLHGASGHDLRSGNRRREWPREDSRFRTTPFLQVRISPIIDSAAEIPGNKLRSPTYTVRQQLSVNNNYSYTTSSPQDRQSLTVRGDYIPVRRSRSTPSATAPAMKTSYRRVCWERAARSSPTTTSTWVPTPGHHAAHRQ